MAKYPEKPTLPTSKKHLARQQREQRQTRLILIVSLVILALVVGLVGFGILDQRVLKPREAVAVVNGEAIRANQFEGQVRYARYSGVQQANSILQFMQLFGNDPSTVGSFVGQLQQIQYQLTPSLIGQQVLENMIENTLVRQEAARRNISVSNAEIEQAFQEAFGFFPDGEPTPTPTLEPIPTSTLNALQMTLLPPTSTPLPTPTETITSTETVSGTETTPVATETGATPENAPAATATEAVELTPTASGPVTPTATLAPTLTPTPYTEEGYRNLRQETVQNFEVNYGISEADLRYVLESQLYRQKVMEAVLAEKNISRDQDQVWLRYLQLPTEDAAQDVLKNLREGADFNAQAAIVTQDPSQSTADLGWLGRETLTAQYGEEVANAAFELQPGEYTEPLETSFGWTIFQALGHEVRALSGSELEGLRQQIFSDWLSEQRAAANIETRDVWMDHVPEEPTLPPEVDQLIQSATQQQQQQLPNLPPEIPLPTEAPPQPTAGQQ